MDFTRKARSHEITLPMITARTAQTPMVIHAHIFSLESTLNSSAPVP